jgi:hypothetical protein
VLKIVFALNPFEFHQERGVTKQSDLFNGVFEAQKILSEVSE